MRILIQKTDIRVIFYSPMIVFFNETIDALHVTIKELNRKYQEGLKTKMKKIKGLSSSTMFKSSKMDTHAKALETANKYANIDSLIQTNDVLIMRSS